jgi:hypothetical protein
MIGAAVASAAIGVVGTLGNAKSVSETAQVNAHALDTQAAYREEKAKYDSAQALTRYQRVRGAQIASAASTGLDIASFSDVMADSAMESALEIKAIKYQGHLEAQNLRFQASGKRTEAENALAAGYLNAGSAVIGAAGKMAGSLPTNSVSTDSPWTTTVRYGA